jgi:hypothetical protein
MHAGFASHVAKGFSLVAYERSASVRSASERARAR